jgi:hypothetical protein
MVGRARRADRMGTLDLYFGQRSREIPPPRTNQREGDQFGGPRGRRPSEVSRDYRGDQGDDRAAIRLPRACSMTGRVRGCQGAVAGDGIGGRSDAGGRPGAGDGAGSAAAAARGLPFLPAIRLGARCVIYGASSRRRDRYVRTHGAGSFHPRRADRQESCTIGGPPQSVELFLPHASAASWLRWSPRHVLSLKSLEVWMF